MKNKTRSLLWPVLVVLVAVVVMVASCQPAAKPTEAPAAKPTEAPAAQPTAEEAATVEPTEEEEEHEPVTLRFLQWSSSSKESMHQLFFDEFTAEYPWITVELEAVPFPEFFETLTAQAAAGNLADVVAADSPEIKHLAYNGVILPLVPDVFSEEELDDFLPSMLEEASYQGQLYGVGTSTSACGLYYNVDLLAAAGIEAPTTLEDGWTAEEAREAWLALTQRTSPDAPPEVWGVMGRNGPLALSSYHGVGWLRSAGEPGSPTYQGISPDGLSVDGYLNTPEVIEALHFLQDLHQVDKVAPLEQIPDAFPTGQAATIEWSQSLINKLETNYPDLNWSIMPLPYFETGFSHAGSFVYTLSRDSQHPEEAAMLIQWLTTPEHIAYWSEVAPGTNLPLRKSVYEIITDYQEMPLLMLYDTMLQWGKSRPTTPGFREYSAIVGTGLKDIMLGAPVEEAVDQMVMDIDAALAAYK